MRIHDMPINFLTFLQNQGKKWHQHILTMLQTSMELNRLTTFYNFNWVIIHWNHQMISFGGDKETTLHTSLHISHVNYTCHAIVPNWHFIIHTSVSLGYANKIHGKVAATSATRVNADSKKIKHLAVVQILRLLLRWGWTTVITTLSASSSAMGRPSALIIKIWDALWLGVISLCRRTRSEIPLKQRAIQLTPLGKLSLEVRRALWSCPSGRGRGTSNVCGLSGSFSTERDTSASFCFLMNVRCLQTGQAIVSLMFPSLLMLTSVLTRQSWQNTCPQLRVLSVPDRHS